MQLNYNELERAYTKSQKDVFRLRAENDALKNGQHWCEITGSSWEQLAQPSLSSRTTVAATVAATNGEDKMDVTNGEYMRQVTSKLRNYEANERLITSAFRQIKYELYCATVDILGFSLHVTQERNCIITSIYNLKEGDTAEFEFIYDPRQHRYVDLVWSDSVAKYAQIYQYWIQENRCIQGFMASVFLEEYNTRGPPLARERPSDRPL